MPRLKLIEMDSFNKMIYFRKDDKLIAFDADVAIGLISDSLDGNNVEVVRCKDCKHYIADGCDECELMSAKSIISSINNKRWHSDFYCAWGERREDAND